MIKDKCANHSILIFLSIILVFRSSMDLFNSVRLVGNINVAFFYGIVLGITLIVILIYQKRKEGLILNVVSKYFILFLLVTFTVGIPSAYLHYGKAGLLLASKEWLRMFMLFLIYLTFYNLADESDPDTVVTILFLSMTIPLILGIYQLFWGNRLFYGVKRIYGSFVHPAPFSYYLALFISLTLWKIIRASARPLWVVVLFIEAFFLCMTWSKGGTLMTILLVLSLLPSSIPYKVKILSVTLLIFILSIWLVYPAGRYRLKRSFHTHISSYRRGKVRLQNQRSRIRQPMHHKEQKFKSEPHVVTSTGWRLMHWKLLLKRFNVSPLTGYGLGTSWKFVSPLQKQAHNDYIKFLVEMGVIGFLAWFLLLVVSARALFLVSKFSDYHKLGYIIFIDFILAYFLCTLFSNIWRNTPFQIYIWALIGLLLGRRAKRGFPRGSKLEVKV